LIGWGRKRSRRWVAIVLPGLFLRALIPVGFMPAFGPGMSLRLALCEDYAPIAPPAGDMSAGMSMNMPMDMSMDMPAHSSGDPSSKGSHQDHTLCPYAASSLLAAQSTFPDVPMAARAQTQPLLLVSQVAHATSAPRAQSARGPPLKV